MVLQWVQEKAHLSNRLQGTLVYSEQQDYLE